MANSDSNSVEKWFTIDLVKKIFEGPFTIEDIKRNLINQKIYWSDIAICPARNLAWVRLFEVKELTELCPPLPSEVMLKHYRNVAFKQNTKIAERLVLPAGGPMATAIDLPKLPTKAVVEKTRVKTMVKERPVESPEVKSPLRAKEKTQVNKVRVSAPQSVTPPSPKTASSSSSGPAEWHLLVDDNECGPFTMQDIENAFKQGKRTERAYVWREGMNRWKPIERVKHFKHLNIGGYGSDFADDEDDEGDFKIEIGRNVRQTNRKHFVASVIRISSSGVAQMIGVTGDMSVAGMKLYQDSLRVNYPIGSKHRLEIKPMKKSKVGSFKVTGLVRWIDPNTYEIGFEFVEINSYDQALLQKYFDTVNKKTD